jgi:hypothetical protein
MQSSINTEVAVRASADSTLQTNVNARVAKTGDTMTGTLNLPPNGLLVGGNQLTVAGGNVGIATNNPKAALEVNNTGGPETLLINSKASSNSVKQGLTLQNPSAFGAGSGVSLHFLMANYDLGTISSVHDGTSSGQKNRLDFAVSDETPVISLLRNGNAGIGTTSPQAKLQVNGGSIYVGSPGQGILLKSPNGQVCRILSIDNTGNMVLNQTTCP